MSDSKIASGLTCKDCRLHRPDVEMYQQLCDMLGVDDCYLGTEAGVEGAIQNDPIRRRGCSVRVLIVESARCKRAV